MLYLASRIWGYVTENFAAVQQGSACRTKIWHSSRNSFAPAFLPQAEKQSLLRRVDDYVAASRTAPPEAPARICSLQPGCCAPALVASRLNSDDDRSYNRRHFRRRTWRRLLRSEP